MIEKFKCLAGAAGRTGEVVRDLIDPWDAVNADSRPEAVNIGAACLPQMGKRRKQSVQERDV
jgi:hypothetical protein